VDIELIVGDGEGRRWHARLAERLAGLPGVTVRVSVVPGRGDRGAELLYRLEGLLYGVAAGHPAERVDVAALPGGPVDGRRADLVVDLTGAQGARAVPVLRLRCNGTSPDDGALAAVLSRENPVLTVDLVADGTERQVVRCPVAVPEPHVAVRAVGPVLGRAVQLVHGIAATVVAGGDVRSLAAVPGNGGEARAAVRRPSPARFATAALAARIANRIRRHLVGAPNWFVGWRRLDGPMAGVPQLGGAPFARIPDDGARFFADPFPIHRDGRDYVFVEEFPYATERGVISVLEILPDGSTTPPRVVLEAETHLSYPFLLEHGDDVYMIPESSRGGRVELWRAVAFPHRWELAAVLIDGVDLADATVVRCAGRWYLFAAPRGEWTSNWDALAVWTAEDLFGPWEPLPSNPVLVDVRAARPGGAVVRAGRQLVRPVQDCTGRYGAALTWAAIDRLDPHGYAQTVQRHDVPPPPLTGLHTYNRSGRIEVVDALGPRSVRTIAMPPAEIPLSTAR
jgi:hypothetical protein